MQMGTFLQTTRSTKDTHTQLNIIIIIMMITIIIMMLMMMMMMIIITMSLFLEHLSMVNMLNCAEQVQIQTYKTHATSACTYEYMNVNSSACPFVIMERAEDRR